MTGKHILFVEDEAPLLELISDALALEGFRVTPARNGVEALELLNREGAGYDVVVSDVSMPEGVSGIDLAERIRDICPSARTILVSGHTRGQLPPLPGNVSFLPKPYRLNQLLDTIRAADQA
jgi:two-component system, cell cycle response regulator CpdR